MISYIISTSLRSSRLAGGWQHQVLRTIVMVMNKTMLVDGRELVMQ